MATEEPGLHAGFYNGVGELGFQEVGMKGRGRCVRARACVCVRARARAPASICGRAGLWGKELSQRRGTEEMDAEEEK